MEYPDFFNRFYTASVKQERLDLINQLSRFVTDGIRSQWGPPYVPTQTPRFEDAIRVALFDVMMYGPKLPKSWKDTSGDTYSIFSHAFRESMLFSHAQVVCTPWLGNETWEKMFEEEYGSQDSKHEQFETSVHGAYECAMNNYVTCEMQRVTLKTIMRLLRQGHRELGGDLQKVANEINTELFNRRKDFLFNALMFGSMIGGAAAQQATRLAAHNTVYDPNSNINFSVMHFIQPGGISPGSYLTAESDALHADIVKYYKQI